MDEVEDLVGKLNEALGARFRERLAQRQCGCREAHCEHEPMFGWPDLPTDQGVTNKYLVLKQTGEPVDAEAVYFVLRIDKDRHAKIAAAAYAASVAKENRVLADDLLEYQNAE